MSTININTCRYFLIDLSCTLATLPIPNEWIASLFHFGNGGSKMTFSLRAQVLLVAACHCSLNQASADFTWHSCDSWTKLSVGLQSSDWGCHDQGTALVAHWQGPMMPHAMSKSCWVTHSDPCICKDRWQITPSPAVLESVRRSLQLQPRPWWSTPLLKKSWLRYITAHVHILHRVKDVAKREI